MENTNGEKYRYRNVKRYSVYYSETDKPLIIYATSHECAAAMGISLNSFYRNVMRIKSGKLKWHKWDIYEDEEDLEDGE